MTKKKELVFCIIMLVLFAVVQIGTPFLVGSLVTDYIFKGDDYPRDISVYGETINGEIQVTGIFSLDNLEDREGSFKESKQWLQDLTNKSFVTIENGGYTHYALKIMNQVESDKWIVLVHGYQSNCRQLSNYAKHFYENGYNILMPNLRGHWGSGGGYITFGWEDRKDLVKWTEKIVEWNTNSKIAMLGVSMGASTVMNATGENLPSNVKVAVADSGFSSILEELEFICSEFLNFYPHTLLSMIEIFSKQMLEFDIKDANVICQLEKSTTPTLFIHGDEDNVVPFDMLDKVYNAAIKLEENVTKKKVVYEGSSHIMASTDYEEEYFQVVFDWINNFM